MQVRLALEDPSQVFVAPEVEEALRQARPVVALESSVFAAGLPPPRRIELARTLETLVREQGAVPATVGIVGGRAIVGLSSAQIERLATGQHVDKVSRRDLGIMVACRKDGGTTVAATMRLAHLAGVRIMATGGIGGVHRGAERTFDISADLVELSHTPAAVVCAGAKALLDLKLTLEWLETAGVPVLGYRTSEFPAFYSRSSGLAVDHTVETPRQAAEVILSSWQLGLRGVIVGVPVPEDQEVDRWVVETAIQSAIDEAARAGIGGRDLTPFMLAKIGEATAEKSIDANIALLKNNARVAADIAKELCTLMAG
ncbi:MAG: pseudouridine-5'-phosphate glycosidase [Chloroflexi bacterium]|nr:pseudouridine-5'-phosphate glycosidase [Chloroflexota bacterium]